ncbi:ABC transporter ATP-binding protein [Aeromicrobium sp. PE09-221]|uniref:ABC transporter ATP-binding protein n=1 Tax=Aeromicrobium sp. PE09-221 TaxID=1898043 RepID=UPI000B3E820E|nr:ABC transporter ATP-binding protein [Aeromicrobium sp. PE09-221]OUZ12890.1 ABC transporter ATP-binding protein [Aeromicrobium sp. PE09-221]
MTSTPLVDIRHATRAFGEHLALDDVSLQIGTGELVGLLGPNGAGKSTLISLLNGLRKPTSGTVRVAGRDPRVPANRVVIGSTPQETGLPPTIKVREVVDFVARHYPDPDDTAALFDRFGLTELAGRQCGSLSGGQQRRLAVALAMVGRPDLVLLDEPTTGLDVDARQSLWSAIEDYQAGGGTVLITSHYLEEIQRLAERVVVIDRGQILVDDSTQAVIDRVDVDRVELSSEDSRLDTLPGVASLARAGDRVTLLTADADALVRALVSERIEFSRLRVTGASLEDAFAHLTRTAA